MQFRLRRFGVDHLHVVDQVDAEDAAAALVHVAHDVAQIRLGDADLQLHDRFQKHGPGVFQPLFEGEGRRELERHFGRVDVVIAAVVEHRAQAGDGVARQNAVRQALDEALFDGGNVLFGHRAAHDLFGEFKRAVERLEAHLAMAVLAVPARLFFVLAFGLDRLADGLAVGDLGRFEQRGDVEFGFELFVDDVQLGLALAA